jgi:hypothetical protein
VEITIETKLKTQKQLYEILKSTLNIENNF